MSIPEMPASIIIITIIIIIIIIIIRNHHQQLQVLSTPLHLDTSIRSISMRRFPSLFTSFPVRHQCSPASAACLVLFLWPLFPSLISISCMNVHSPDPASQHHEHQRQVLCCPQHLPGQLRVLSIPSPARQHCKSAACQIRKVGCASSWAQVLNRFWLSLVDARLHYPLSMRCGSSTPSVHRAEDLSER